MLGRLVSPRSPISKLVIVSTTRFQESEDKNPSQVDDDCFIISQETKQSNKTFSIFPPQLAGLHATDLAWKKLKGLSFHKVAGLTVNQLT